MEIFMSSSAPNAVLSVSGIGKTYAQPVLSDITLTLIAVKCWR
jgi:ribose transport system ATP-binding protein